MGYYSSMKENLFMQQHDSQKHYAEQKKLGTKKHTVIPFMLSFLKKGITNIL